MKPLLRFPRVVALVGLLAAGPSALLAQGTAFTYQGLLSDNGQPANGSYDLTFTLFDHSDAGSQAGNPITNSATTVANGLFITVLDFGSGVFSGSNLWLEVGVRTNGGGSAYSNLSPRQAVLATPYAIMANTASNLAGTLSASNLSGTVVNAQLANDTLTVKAGPGLAGGGIVALGGSTTLSNAGILSITGNVDITASTSNGVVKLGSSATATNTANTIVKRDGSGNFSAGSLTLNGNLVAKDVKLANGSQPAVSALDSARIVWGGIHGDGSVAFGTWFTASRTSAGTYTLNFSPSFIGLPSVLFTPPYGQTAVWTTTFGSLATNSVVIKSWNGSLQADADFSFVAIGPR